MGHTLKEGKKDNQTMVWYPLNSIEDIETIKNRQGYSLIFKHSTRCSVSLMAKKQFELDWNVIPQGVPLYLLDVLNKREISNKIAELFSVEHQSPQILLIENGKCILNASHHHIDADEIAEKINQKH